MENASVAYNRLLGMIRDLVFEKKAAQLNHEIEEWKAKASGEILSLQMAMISLEENLTTDELQRLNIFLGMFRD